MATATDLAYMAGLFDGEGCIGINAAKRKNRPSKTYFLYCKINMCNPYISQLFKFAFGGSTWRYKYENRRDVWTWQITDESAVGFLKALLPYLRLKTNEAELAIQFRKRFDGSFAGHGALPESELAIREAERILLSKMKDKSIEEVK